MTDGPTSGRDLTLEPSWQEFLGECRRRYSQQDGLPHEPRPGYLEFASSVGIGPLGVFALLSDEGKVRYTKALIELDASFESWEIRHTGTNAQAYPKMRCESLTVHLLRKHGRVRTSGGIVPLSDAIGPDPGSREALHILLNDPKAEKLKAAFELIEPDPEFRREGDPTPLTDVWPGLKEHLRPHQRSCQLVLCEAIQITCQSKNWVLYRSNVYLAAPAINDHSARGLRLVMEALELRLNDRTVEQILNHRTPAQVEERRAAIRELGIDAERLLAAVREPARLRSALPESLLDVLQSEPPTLTGIDIAKASIATWHTDALRHHRGHLDHLNPPTQWAGSARAVQFVRSLGFSSEWAGERSTKRDPFLEVPGPCSLPDLHDYQRTIVENVRALLRGEPGNEAERRGLISLPTGSGKTRVAVQAIVEAMRHDELAGGILWVADRDELCEQAVEAWRQVWSGVGAEGRPLRVSRMWGGQPRPLPTSDLHVVVATIQTLSARLSSQRPDYEFLTEFNLVVFDEAHRSVAPTFTSVMQEIGLTRFRREDEPLLIGLTATPYRGHDEEETTRLVRRYGSRRLDSGAFDSDEPENVIRQLQDMGVLAEADHETIEGGTFSLETILSDDRDSEGQEPADLEQLLQELRELPWLPQSVEKRIAGDAKRTRRIVEAYEEHIGSNWPTLIFATSVEHSQTVAALLNRRGIPSRAVSGKTEPATRRRIVGEFRRGEIKALVNYGVFREGFDAPKTRAIIVARPVYSPNLYFQMIGRGLRGPRNGGAERCLIINVQDNIENYDRALAFSELDWLWAD